MATHPGRRRAALQRRLEAEAAEAGDTSPPEAEVRPAATGGAPRRMPGNAGDLDMAIAALATTEEDEG